jgi:hypothetical protein
MTGREEHMKKIRRILAKARGRSLSGDFLLSKRGGDMWDDLVKWLQIENEHYPNNLTKVLDKMKEIEKEYGVE